MALEDTTGYVYPGTGDTGSTSDVSGYAASDQQVRDQAAWEQAMQDLNNAYVTDPYQDPSRSSDVVSNYPSLVADTTGSSTSSDFISWLKNFLGNGAGGIGSGGAAGLMGLMALLGRAKAHGGGAGAAYGGPKTFARTITPSATPGIGGPIARYAADGGIMHAYNEGGKVQMQDGGFVLTKRAIDGAGGPRGIAQLLPGVQMFRGPGTGTSDSIPAQINGPRGATPARVSNGEGYMSPRKVADSGGAAQVYSIMKQLEKRGG